MSRSCPTCHHVLPTNKRCGSPALRGEMFCFYHHPNRPASARRPAPSHISFEVPAIADSEALQIALSEVIRRLADNTLDARRASLLLITLKMAQSNLPSLPAYPSEELFGRDSASSAGQSPDLRDLSELLAIAGLQPTASF